MRKEQWVYHPESPGVRIKVTRGFWGRLFKPKGFATLCEAHDHYLMTPPSKRKRTPK